MPRRERRFFGAHFLGAAISLAACSEPPCATQIGFICPIAGTGEIGFNHDGLPGPRTELFLVSAARTGPDGRVYIMDFNNQRLRVIDDAGVIQTVVGNGTHALAATGVAPTDSPLENPIDFRFFSDGRIVFVSYHDPRILTVDDGGLLQAIAGTGEVGVEGNEGDGGPALEAMFIQPDGIALGPDDSIYVSDSLAHRVRLIRDGTITTVAGNGSPGYTGDGGPAVEASLFWPTALELDAARNLLIADTRNHAVRRVAPDGTISTIAGRGAPGSEGDGGPATAAALDQPTGLALDADGSLYISDRANFRVRRIDPDGTIETVAGTGVEGDDGDGGPAVEARLGYLSRVSLDEEGLLVADQSSCRVRRVVGSMR